MGWMQMPLFSWSILVANVMLFLSIPAFGVGLIQVYLERVVGTAFYDIAAGGDPLLWSHLFWYFGHPEVYVVIVPSFGIISEVIATSSRRSVFGYRSMVYALAGIGIVAFIVYGHHMFTSGMSPTLRFVTMLTTMLVAVPTGIKIFNWLMTMHGGSLVYRTHTLWALGFLVTFTLGGISGMFFPSIAMDTHLHESYFVVAHFHYVLVGGTVFGFFAGIYYWWPKATGKMLSEKLGVLHFLTAFVSYNALFWPMHRLGVWGMTRRHHTYFVTTEEALGSLPMEAAGWNMFITCVQPWLRPTPSGSAAADPNPPRCRCARRRPACATPRCTASRSSPTMSTSWTTTTQGHTNRSHCTFRTAAVTPKSTVRKLTAVGFCFVRSLLI